MAPRSNRKDPPRQIAGVDADEVESVQVAARVLKEICPSASNPEAVAYAVISAWVVERMKRQTSARITDNVVFNIGDAKLGGIVSASLGKIAETLGAAGFDFAKSFNDLSKDEAINLFLAGVLAHRDAAVMAGEAVDFPFSEAFSDPVPFGLDLEKLAELEAQTGAVRPLSVDEAPW